MYTTVMNPREASRQSNDQFAQNGISNPKTKASRHDIALKGWHEIPPEAYERRISGLRERLAGRSAQERSAVVEKGWDGLSDEARERRLAGIRNTS